MIDGQYTVYVIQGRLIAQSEWCKPDGALHPVSNNEWFTFNWDVIGGYAEPWVKFLPQYRQSSDEVHDVWSKTRIHGWRTLLFAIRGLKRVQKANDNGNFDFKDGYGRKHQAQRYEFRIIKIDLSQNTSILNINDVINAV